MGDTTSARPAVIPALGKVAAALKEVTEVLAREIAEPTRHPPPWNDFEWRIARAVTAMQGTASILDGRLRWTRPPAWRRFLEEQRDHIGRRHGRIELLLDALDSKARSGGISLVALKGAALHKMAIYAAGERPMADIDLLAQECDANAVSKLIEDCGFESTLVTRRDLTFEPRRGDDSARAGLGGDAGLAEPGMLAEPGGLGEHADGAIKIELHTRIREPLPFSEIDITRHVSPRPARAGINGYPSNAALMLHLLLHAAGTMRAHGLRLIQLNDIARLAAEFRPADWEKLLCVADDDGGLWWAAAPLMMTARYFPAAIPRFATARLESVCPRLLRRIISGQRLYDVSWSNIRVYAFPGIEWSRTPKEAFRFIMSRVLPAQEALRELREFASHQPGVSAVPWYGVSHGTRILRWVFSKPPRVQCMLAVRAALDLPS
jgi:hypothetical protein